MSREGHNEHFCLVKDILVDNDLLNMPSSILNADETGLQLNYCVSRTCSS